jgi:hypothetical protein
MGLEGRPWLSFLFIYKEPAEIYLNIEGTFNNAHPSPNDTRYRDRERGGGCLIR